jgi:hypothetical protein
MFEYLMPGLLMRSQEGTLLAQTSALAVEAQIAYAKHEGEPWGISESAYARVDADQTYQYRSFGVPGPRLQARARGRSRRDSVRVAPGGVDPAAGRRPQRGGARSDGHARNVRAVRGGRLHPGTRATGASRAKRATVLRRSVVHGTPSRHDPRRAGQLLEPAQYGRPVSFRSRGSRRGEALLNERAPGAAPAEWPVADGAKSRGADSRGRAAPRAPSPMGGIAEQRVPQAFVLSNGRLTSW